MRWEAPVDRFGSTEWAMTLTMATIFGSAFLWTSIALDWVDPPVVSLFRCAFGSLALACLPGSRRRVDLADVPRLAFIGLGFMALPFVLFPIAQTTVSSSVAGMIHGGLPLVTVVVTALLTRTAPSAVRVTAVLIGFAGIALISFASVRGSSSADARGVALILLSNVSYAVAANFLRPMQLKYGAVPTMLWSQALGVVWSLPFGLASLGGSALSWQALGAMFMLGAVVTGFALAIFALLHARVGTVRGMIGLFFTPIVGTILGVAVRGEHLHPLAVVGMLIVIAGAVMTSRPEPARHPAGARLPARSGS